MFGSLRSLTGCIAERRIHEINTTAGPRRQDVGLHDSLRFAAAGEAYALTANCSRIAMKIGMTNQRQSSLASENSPAFVTDYLPLASFLLSRGHTVELQETGSGTVLFSFAGTAPLSSAVAAYHAGAAQVEPAQYDAARIQLRRMMDAQKDRRR